MALLNYRTTPLPGVDLSPAQLLMGRRPRNTLPASRRFNVEKSRQKFQYDSRNHVNVLPTFEPGQHVRLESPPGSGSTSWKAGTVAQHYNAPRSYTVKQGTKVYRCKHLRSSTSIANAGETEEFDNDSLPIPDPTSMDAKGDNSASCEPSHGTPPSYIGTTTFGDENWKDSSCAKKIDL